MTGRSSFEAKVLAAFTAAVLVVAALSATTWKLSKDAADAAQWVMHTQEVLRCLADVQTGSLQIEVNTQSFRISGESGYLAERDAAVAKREVSLSRLKALTSNNPHQQERWAKLREVINQRLAISRQVQILRSTLGAAAANDYVTKAPLKETRERAYGLMRAMEDEENQLLTSRTAEQQRTQRVLAATSTWATLSLFVLLAGTYVLLRRQWREAEASRKALADSEESLSTTLHSIGDAVLATDTRGCVTRMNTVAEALTGWAFNEAMGRPIAEVFHIINEQTRAPAVIPVDTVLETGEVQEIANHTAIISRQGTECPIADSAAPIRDSTGSITGVVLVFRDVTLAREAQLILEDQNQALDRRVQEQMLKISESEGHLHSVIHNVPAMIAYVDAQQRYVYVNELYRKRFAPDHLDITGRTVREVLGEERYAKASPLIAKVLLEGAPQNYDWQPFPGVWQAISYAPRRNAQGAVCGYYVLGTDITERKQSEARIEALNEELERRVQDLKQLGRALRTLSAGNRTMLRATDEQALLDSMCSAIVDAGGYQAATVWYRADDEAGSLYLAAEHGASAAASGAEIESRQAPPGFGTIVESIRKDQVRILRDARLAETPQGGEFHQSVSVISCPLRVGGETIGAIAIFDKAPNTFGADEVALLTESADDLAYGISTLRVRHEQKKNREAMHRLTHYDSLTGLPNETRFTEAIEAALDAGMHGHRRFAVLQANVERLGEINDALGFSHGDQMLCEFAARLRRAAPDEALVARLRGDEFALLLPDADADAAVAMARHLEKTLARPFPIAALAIDVSARIGIALFPAHGTSAHDLYRNMDIAMHLAKTREENHVLFDPAQNPDRSRRLMVVSELRQAIEGGELALYLQPKVEMRTGIVCGAEGLVRWKHPTRGMIPPVEFIGLAESTGLIKPLTEWVMETAMGLNQAWAQAGRALPVAVNFSMRNLHDEKLLEKLRRLQSSSHAAGLFEIEITETSVMEDAEYALRVLHNLRDQGIALYIDDFGTGYSSLAYLQKFPVKYIKIDQSFVRDMGRSKDSEAIVRSTIDLIHDLGRVAVAEGVEDRELWDRLAAMGCDIAQGYFIAKPMPAEDFHAWLDGYRSPWAPASGEAPSLRLLSDR